MKKYCKTKEYSTFLYTNIEIEFIPDEQMTNRQRMEYKTSLDIIGNQENWWSERKRPQRHHVNTATDSYRSELKIL